MKKILSLLLAVIMAISCIGGVQLTAYAEKDYTQLAAALPTDDQWSGDNWITETNNEHWYSVTIPSDGLFTLKIMSYFDDIYTNMWTYDLTKEVVDEYFWGANEVTPKSETYTRSLSAGTYYVKISGDTGKYKISAGFASYYTNDFGANSYDSPLNLSSGYQITGAITQTDKEDWYKIYVPSPGTYSFRVTSRIDDIYTNAWNYDLTNQVIDEYFWGANELTPKTETYNKVLSAGTYYIKISGDCGWYNLSWNVLSPENCNHEFESFTVCPTYLQGGYTVNTCKICGYSYNNQYTAKLKVNNPSIYKIEKGKKKLIVNINTVYDVDGYQIRYSTSKKFTKSKTKTLSTKKYRKTVSKLKGKKKYYVQVRAYKYVDGRKVYSSWSKTRGATTK